MWNVQCVSLVDMTCFASFRTQTIAEVPCHVIFFCEALYRWHGTYAFFCFFTLQMTWELSFFGYVRQLPCHQQVLYILWISVTCCTWGPHSPMCILAAVMVQRALDANTWHSGGKRCVWAIWLLRCLVWGFISYNNLKVISVCLKGHPLPINWQLDWLPASAW